MIAPLIRNDYGIGVAGVGKFLPEGIITNESLEESSGMKADEIAKKTGIITRRKASDDDVASDMCAAAARDAMAMAGIEADQLGLIITCTFTGDYTYPAVSCRIQDLLGAHNAGAFDLLANCTGFQVGLGVASDRMLVDPNIKYTLVIGAALQSRFIDYSNSASAIYFGDGVGAAILKQVPPGYGILSNDVSTNGRAFNSVRLRGGGSSHPLRPGNINDGLQYYEIDGLEVWKQVIQNQPKSMRRALEKIEMTTDDVDFFIFHQANLRLIEFLMGKMRLPMDKTYTNVEEYGNTADASQAITLCDAVNHNLLKRDDLVAISGVGAGFIFGTTVMRWY
jgi:3-oxoacyl-[acyl-carrier-protein] synthase III